MSEQINGRQVFTLLEVTRSIQKTISSRYKTSFWMKAEMNKLNFYQHSGHCYPDLVEKQDNRIVAQMRANLWKDDYNRINSDFERILKEPLKDGVKILLQATIGFTPEHGLSLRIVDIDPSFTLGDLEREKQETIQRLQAEGIFNRNKELMLPMLPQRIALISVQTSKGYADFGKVLEAARKTWGYAFFCLLFPSLLQGDNAVQAIIQQLRRIKKAASHFDAVAIVRGGGGDIGLSCYNHYDLAREIALFPLPVITGIGHATNETVTELIAFENAITPTKLADFLVQKFHNFSVPLKNAEESIASTSLDILREEKARFAAELKLLRSAARTIIGHHRNSTSLFAQSVSQQLRFRIQTESNALADLPDRIRTSTTRVLNTGRQVVVQVASDLSDNSTGLVDDQLTMLKNLEQSVKHLDPSKVLKRGYSITTVGGKLLRSANKVSDGDVIETALSEGRVTSIIKSVNEENT